MSTHADRKEGPPLLLDGLRTVEEAREYTRLSRSALYTLMNAGSLQYTKIGRRRLIPYRALVELAARGLVEN
jgi:excisionase family DNA binding protein